MVPEQLTVFLWSSWPRSGMATKRRPETDSRMRFFMVRSSCFCRGRWICLERSAEPLARLHVGGIVKVRGREGQRNVCIGNIAKTYGWERSGKTDEESRQIQRDI